MRLAPLWLLLHALVAIAPAVGLFFGAPDASLFGVEEKVTVAKITVDRWMHEEVQKDIKGWFEASLGFRGVLVRTDNTLFYSSLHETRPGSLVKLGVDDTLFINDDIWYNSKRPQELPPLGDMPSEAVLIAEMQHLLEARGKHLLVIIAPSKTSLYPDKVPADFKRREKTEVPPDRVVYEAFRRSLVEAGVKFADGRALLTADPSQRELLFPVPGRHWSEVGACRVLGEATKGIIPPMPCRYAIEKVDISFDDLDLYRLLNRWRLDEPPLLPVLTTEPTAENRPSVLYVGSSFCFRLVRAGRPHFRDGHLFYYNSSVYDDSFPSHEIDKVDPAKPAWEHYVLDKDVYIIEVLEPYAHGSVTREFLTTLRSRL